MKITKRELKFDLVLEGEKIKSLDELREHPSTELLELQKDGRLSRWLRTHGGTNEADKICEMSLSGDTARDLYAICQVLAVDIELEDIIDALKYESPKDTVPACVSVEEEYCKYHEEDPEIKQRKNFFQTFAGAVGKELRSVVSGNYILMTNIDSVKGERYVDFISDVKCIMSDYSILRRYDNISKIISKIYSDYGKKNKILVFKGDDIFIKDYLLETQGFLRYAKYIFIQGENVVISLTDLMKCEFIFIIAKNLYINEIKENTYIVAENIFIESQYTGNYKYIYGVLSSNNSVVCAKNMLSIGYGWGIPPFMKSKEDLLSQKVSINRNYPSIPNLLLSAGTFLYGCHKEGCALDASLAIPCYNVMKRTMLDWAEENGIFTADFWQEKDEEFGW